MTQTSILPFIPQRPPFVMIDEILEVGESQNLEPHMYTSHPFRKAEQNQTV